MKVLIIGGAGYIGSHCNRYFAEQGIDTVVLDDFSTGHRNSIMNGKLIYGNFGDIKIINDILDNEKPDAIFHFAAFADVSDSVINPSKYYKNNVSNMVVLLDAMVRNNIKYIVFSSSAAIFGEPITVASSTMCRKRSLTAQTAVNAFKNQINQCLPIDEDHSKNPISPYGRSKLMGEQLLQDYDYAYGIKYCSLRYFNACGAWGDNSIGESHKPEHHLIPFIFNSIKTGIPLKVFGGDYDNTKDGSCLRDYIHVNDIANAHYLGLQYIMENNKSECFNIGSNNGYTVLEIIKICEKVTGLKVPYEIMDRRCGDPQSLLASNQKAKDLLDWEPKNDIYKIIMDAWNWENNRKF